MQPSTTKSRPASIRLPAETEAALMETEAYKSHGLAYANAVAVHQALKLDPPLTPTARKSAGGAAGIGEAKRRIRKKAKRKK